MSIQEAYLVMYNILNDYYFQESDNHYLASLLSDMDPNVFMDKMSADPATYFDWLSCVECYIVNEEIKDENIILALKSFLRFYQQEFGYQLEDVIDYFDLRN